MPTYDYMCKNCGHKFEQFQSITASPIRKCPACGRKELKRLLGSGAGVIFKGPGFYQTDYRSESYKKSEKSEKDTTNKDATEKKTETKTESKGKKPGEKTKPDTNDKKKSA